MGITTQLVQGILIIEIFLFCLILLPIPGKKRLLTTLATQRNMLLKGAVHIILVIYAMISVMFLDSLNKIYKYKRMSHISKSHDHMYFVYHAERNFYLTGFTLFLALVFHSFIKILIKLNQDESNAKILKKQSMNQKDFVAKIMKDSKEKDDVIKELTEKSKKDQSLVKQANNNISEYNKLLKKYNLLVEKFTGENKKSA